ncbi:MAG: hypothetical protein U1D36_11510 [Hydrogenophaga sp.]|nr:hypothetical protein [Hydrogenophaga sp.]MDP2405926.1 hypothetical protein [Hydrogenophaga sp.]MDZ4175085.1 hypothetical protein [Hydrogenophaga sp.]
MSLEKKQSWKLKKEVPKSQDAEAHDAANEDLEEEKHMRDSETTM